MLRHLPLPDYRRVLDVGVVVGRHAPGGQLLLDIYHREAIARLPTDEREIRRGREVRTIRTLEGDRYRVRLSYSDSGDRDEFEWRVFTPEELAAEGAACGLSPLLACAWFDADIPASPEHVRMQLLFERAVIASEPPIARDADTDPHVLDAAARVSAATTGAANRACADPIPPASPITARSSAAASVRRPCRSAPLVLCRSVIARPFRPRLDPDPFTLVDLRSGGIGSSRRSIVPLWAGALDDPLVPERAEPELEGSLRPRCDVDDATRRGRPGWPP